MSFRRVDGLKFGRLSWPGIEIAIHTLAQGLLANDNGKSPFDRPGVYGPPLDGAVLAIMMAQKLALPWLRRPRRHCIWIDAFYDEKTWARDRKRARNMLPCAWVARYGAPVLHFRGIDDETWLMVPWGNEQAAEQRARAYALKRRKTLEENA